MTVFDDLGAEQERLEKILAGLDEEQWLSALGAPGWTIADVVLHLAQSEEAVEATATHHRPAGAADLRGLVQASSRPGPPGPGLSEPGVDGFGLQGQDGEDAFVDTPQRLAAGHAVQGLQAQGVLAQRQRALVAEPALA